jgi:hypothetical protein
MVPVGAPAPGAVASTSAVKVIGRPETDELAVAATVVAVFARLAVAATVVAVFARLTVWVSIPVLVEKLASPE